MFESHVARLRFRIKTISIDAKSLMAWDGLKFLRCVQQKENERSKKIAAELQLDKLILKERQYQTNDFLSTALATPQNRSIMTLTR
ncbi:MAG: hypothetical protein HOI86_01140 [Tateyamaria sp.]|jgi:hypothetical protein|nr:hypothetical protein [Tateyamaria sp.]MBT7802530.1 hypothetical protein [Tateyamaria sp.]